MKPEGLQERTTQYALRIIKVVRSLGRSLEAQVIGRQLLKAGTSVASNYRAARRARSRNEFVAKMGVVEEEGDESVFWQELIVRAGMLKSMRLADLMAEGNGIVAIAVRSKQTARAGKLARANRQSTIGNRQSR